MTGMQVSKFQNYVFGSDVFNSNSGLDVSKDQILEIACVITDKELIVLAEVCVSHHR
jgi:oligoribonuclease (3'-5' exoribonuclease)